MDTKDGAVSLRSTLLDTLKLVDRKHGLALLEQVPFDVLCTIKKHAQSHDIWYANLRELGDYPEGQFALKKFALPPLPVNEAVPELNGSNSPEIVEQEVAEEDPEIAEEKAAAALRAKKWAITWAKRLSIYNAIAVSFLPILLSIVKELALWEKIFYGLVIPCFSFFSILCGFTTQKAHVKLAARTIVYLGMPYNIIAIVLWPVEVSSTIILFAIAFIITPFSTMFSLRVLPPDCTIGTRALFVLKGTSGRLDVFTDAAVGIALINIAQLRGWGISICVFAFLDYFAVQMAMTKPDATFNMMMFTRSLQIICELPIVLLTIAFFSDPALNNDVFLTLLSLLTTVMSIGYNISAMQTLWKSPHNPRNNVVAPSQTEGQSSKK